MKRNLIIALVAVVAMGATRGHRPDHHLRNQAGNRAPRLRQPPRRARWPTEPSVTPMSPPTSSSRSTARRSPSASSSRAPSSPRPSPPPRPRIVVKTTEVREGRGRPAHRPDPHLPRQARSDSQGHRNSRGLRALPQRQAGADRGACRWRPRHRAHRPQGRVHHHRRGDEGCRRRPAGAQGQARPGGEARSRTGTGPGSAQDRQLSAPRRPPGPHRPGRRPRHRCDPPLLERTRPAIQRHRETGGVFLIPFPFPYPMCSGSDRSRPGHAEIRAPSGCRAWHCARRTSRRRVPLRTRSMPGSLGECDAVRFPGYEAGRRRAIGVVAALSINRRATTSMVRRWAAGTPMRHSGPEGRSSGSDRQINQHRAFTTRAG